MQQTAMVTGASTGIGYATVKVLAGNGFHVFAGVRREADGARLASDFGASVTPLIFDVTDEAGVAEAATRVRERLQDHLLTGLVNNAGMAIGGPLMHQPIADIRRQFEVNVFGTIMVTQSFLPLLGARDDVQGTPGRIVNISSVGGRIAAPFLGAYAGSKHALEGMSDSLRRELMLYGIDVIVIEPGSVVTPIWDKAEAAEIEPYVNTKYTPILLRFRDYFINQGRNGLPPEVIGEAVFKALTAKRPPARIVLLRDRFMRWTLPRLLPDRVLDRMIASRTGLLPQG